MDGTITFASLIPLVAVFFGALVSALLGMILSGQKQIVNRLDLLNGKVFAHLTQPGIHESAVVKLEEQIKNVLKVAELSHERIDSIKGRG